MGRRIGGDNVKTQQETGTVLREASQKELVQMAAENQEKGKYSAADIITTCSLCSDHAVCYCMHILAAHR